MRGGEGVDLATTLEHSGPLSAGRAVEIIRQTATALDTAHAAGLVHRDVKAQNVIREEGGRLVLMDFGTGLLLDGLAAFLGEQVTA